MARELPIIKPGNVICYQIGQCNYVSVVMHVSGLDSNGYLQLEIYDLQTPSNTNFSPATRKAPVEISLSPFITKIVVHDYATYVQQYPELFLLLRIL